MWERRPPEEAAVFVVLRHDTVEAESEDRHHRLETELRVLHSQLGASSVELLDGADDTEGGERDGGGPCRHVRVEEVLAVDAVERVGVRWDEKPRSNGVEAGPPGRERTDAATRDEHVNTALAAGVEAPRHEVDVGGRRRWFEPPLVGGVERGDAARVLLASRRNSPAGSLSRMMQRAL